MKLPGVWKTLVDVRSHFKTATNHQPRMWSLNFYFMLLSYLNPSFKSEEESCTLDVLSVSVCVHVVFSFFFFLFP